MNYPYVLFMIDKIIPQIRSILSKQSKILKAVGNEEINSEKIDIK